MKGIFEARLGSFVVALARVGGHSFDAEDWTAITRDVPILDAEADR